MPNADVYLNYSAPQERLRPYLDDGFEVVCIDPQLSSVVEDAEQPDEYFDTARFVYMVKELEDVTSFDRDKYKPDNYDCTLLYERENWVQIQNLTNCFRRENDPFGTHDVPPFIEFPSWPGTVKELTPEEKAAEKERIQSLYDSLQRGKIKLKDIDIIDLLIINKMLHKELDRKKLFLWCDIKLSLRCFAENYTHRLVFVILPMRDGSRIC